MAAEYRTERVGRLIQEKIGALIVEGKIKDPRIDPFLSVTRVRVSRDFSYADVYVSSFKPASSSADKAGEKGKGISEGSLSRALEGLRSAAGFIQAQIAGQMRIRQTPRLRFHEDRGIKEGFEIVKKIEDLSDDNDAGN
ncbi:MAG: 30S ribosome-binding factor RbfA [Treponema sp.]|jgi:ribosome-binding factor A|nr:30S ribosome-binding factor RbfA [Treponema sp.]